MMIDELTEEIKQEGKEKEEREWRNRHSAKQLKEDYPDLIPPSRYDEIFVSQISETEFIVDDENNDYFELYNVEPDFENLYNYDEMIGVYHSKTGEKSYHIGSTFLEEEYNETPYDEIMVRDRIDTKVDDTSLYGFSTDSWSDVLERVRNNENWIKFSQENRDWLEKQDKLLTPIEEELERVEKLNKEFRDEWSKRRDNDDKFILKYHSLYLEFHDLGREIFDLDSKKRFPEPDFIPDVSLPEYDGLSFEGILKQMIDEMRKEINDRKEYLKEKGIEK